MVLSPALTFESVSIAWPGEAPHLRNISFSVQPGERVALVGLNGSGKTTLLMACAGLVPHTGHIAVDSTPLESGTHGRVRNKIGVLFNVPEDQLFFPTVRDDVLFSLSGARLSKAEKIHRCHHALHKLGIAQLEHRPLHNLSHGQKQRVALAGAMVSNPGLLLLDEPTSALDPVARRQLQHTLIKESSAMIIATHDLAFAAQTCHRCLFVSDGTVKTDWTLPQIESHWEILAGAE